ncbi:MAG: efflux RND transporter periplasmic adaptor subunit [Bacteroidaceae bacterium]|nr:efflux RND transporter periplasmic adaptor subunit [Bacteroidaceae bacterium]
MDRPIEKKHPLIRYKYYIASGVAFLILLIYVIVSTSGAKKLRVEVDSLIIEEVKNDKFLEYVDVEGLVHPILTIKVNAQESGSVARIVGEVGSMMKKGDTILVLDNPELVRTIEDQRDDLEKQLVSYQEKAITMEQQSLNLKKQILENEYQLKKLQKQYDVDVEEFNMGITSKAQLEVKRDEYEFNMKSAELQREGLKHDSAVSVIRRDLMESDLEREKKKFSRVRERLDKLVVYAPISGQLSDIGVTPGQQVSAGSNIGDIKVLDQYKISTALSEYYIDRVTLGLPATINYQGTKFPLKITKVVPEVKDRTFAVDLVFAGEMPDNVRVGKSYRVQIELGQPEDAVVIPRGNFFQSNGGQWIYKVNEAGDKAIRVPISVGRQNPQQYEIIDGLKPGDKVIVSGYDNFGDAEVLILKK